MARRLNRRTFVKSSLLAGFGLPLLNTDGKAASTERLRECATAVRAAAAAQREGQPDGALLEALKEGVNLFRSGLA